ncbi:ribonuclease P protein component, partial [bacterium]|nr:ribonuclease P protein component [bacterium]
KKQKIQRSSFPKTFSGSKTFPSPFFTLRVFFDKKNSTTSSRFSFVVSAKVAKKAVARNTLKRRGYAVIKKNIPNIKSGYICVFFFKKESTRVSFKDLEKEIVITLKRANVFTN